MKNLYKEGVFLNRSNFNWGPGLFLITYHIILLVGIPLYLMQYTPSAALIITSAVLMYITGLSVTVGYHRLYSHTTYKTKPVVEAVLLFFGAMATEGSALRWSFDHRYHHAFVDTDKDPYSIKKGFWYAHFMWLFEKPREIENKVVSDLVKNPLVSFQHRYYPTLMFATNILATAAIGWYFNDFLAAFLFGWMLRLFFLHHLTWFINSLAHTWGQRTFCQELSAVDNYIIALLTFGEGYHNYHHTFAYDYRNGIKWFHFDPTKWIIWTLSKLGLASKLKKNQRFFIEERILLNRKRILLDALQDSYEDQKEVLKETITTLSDSAQKKLRQMKELSERYQSAKKSKNEKDLLIQLRSQLKEAKKEFQKDWDNWLDVSKDLMASHPVKSAH